MTRADRQLDSGQVAHVEYIERGPLWFRRLALASLKVPRFLYKYLSFDPSRSLDVQKLRGIVVDSDLYLASPTAFNDPFDFRCHVTTGDPLVFRQYMEKKVRLQRGGRKVRAQLLRNAIGRSGDKDLIRKTWDRIADDYGVLCLSANARSIPMWSHYSASHTGVCLQFDCARDYGLFGLAREVQYRREFPHLKWPDDRERMVQEVLYGKFDEWKYEREHRYVLDHQPNSLLGFEPAALSGIIIGYRFSEHQREALQQLIGERLKRRHPPLRIWWSTRSLTDYRLRVFAPGERQRRDRAAS